MSARGRPERLGRSKGEASTSDRSKVRNVSVQKPVHRRRRQHVARCVTLVRGPIAADVRGWVDENLQSDLHGYWRFRCAPFKVFGCPANPRIEAVAGIQTLVVFDESRFRVIKMAEVVLRRILGTAGI